MSGGMGSGGLEVWSLEVRRPEGLEVWKSGGLEVWSSDVWRSGGLEVWRSEF